MEEVCPARPQNDEFCEMRSRLNTALRLLAGEQQTATADVGAFLLGFGLNLDGSQSRSAQGSSCAPVPYSARPGGGTSARDRAVQELLAAVELVSAIEDGVGSGRPKPEVAHPDMDFMTSVKNAPAHTREWLLAQFSHQERMANRSGSIDLDENNAANGRIRRSTLGSQISEESAQLGLALPEVVELLASVGLLGFDSLAFSKLEAVHRRGISMLGAHIESQQGFIRKMHSDGVITDQTGFRTAYLNFLAMVDELYLPDAMYHGSAHAMDVMSTSTWLMKSPVMAQTTRPLEYFMVLVAAAVHDVGHPGVNNLFLMKTMDPIAVRYNDKSCLENMHLAITFELMQKDDQCDWLRMLENSGTNSSRQYMREGLISMVLATDMANHARYVKQMDQLLIDRAERAEGATADPKALEDEHLFLLDIIVHASDISNPAKPQATMLAWTKRVNFEFWAQGDQERNLGLEMSPLCDRTTGRPALAKGQIGFINFVVMPFFKTIAEVLPEAKEAVDALKATTSFWKEIEQKGASFEEIFDGIEPLVE